MGGVLRWPAALLSCVLLVYVCASYAHAAGVPTRDDILALPNLRFFADHRTIEKTGWGNAAGKGSVIPEAAFTGAPKRAVLQLGGSDKRVLSFDTESGLSFGEALFADWPALTFVHVTRFAPGASSTGVVYGESASHWTGGLRSPALVVNAFPGCNLLGPTGLNRAGEKWHVHTTVGGNSPLHTRVWTNAELDGEGDQCKMPATLRVNEKQDSDFQAAAVLLFDRALRSQELDLVHEYLCHTYGVHCATFRCKLGHDTAAAERFPVSRLYAPRVRDPPHGLEQSALNSQQSYAPPAPFPENYLQVDLGTEMVVQGLYLQKRPGFDGDHYPLEFHVGVSKDGNKYEWETVKGCPRNSGHLAIGRRVLSRPRQARFVRLKTSRASGTPFFRFDLAACDPCDPAAEACDPLTRCAVDVSDADGFTCSDCPFGYLGDGKVGCGDVDECAVVKALDTRGICGSGGACGNLDGGYECSCKSGYELATNRQRGSVLVNAVRAVRARLQGVLESTSDPAELQQLKEHAALNDQAFQAFQAAVEAHLDRFEACVNINECESGEAHCAPAGSACVDTEGSYECRCLEGFQGSGRVCTPAPEQPAPQVEPQEYRDLRQQIGRRHESAGDLLDQLRETLETVDGLLDQVMETPVEEEMLSNEERAALRKQRSLGVVGVLSKMAQRVENLEKLHAAAEEKKLQMEVAQDE